MTLFFLLALAGLALLVESWHTRLVSSGEDQNERTPPYRHDLASVGPRPQGRVVESPWPERCYRSGRRKKITEPGEFAKLSRKTKDAAKAKRRYHEAAAALSRHYEALRHSPTKITQQQATALAGDYFRSLLQRHGDNPGEADQWLDGMDSLIAAPPFPRADRNGLMAIIRFGFSLTFMLLSRPFGRIPWCVYTPINV